MKNTIIVNLKDKCFCKYCNKEATRYCNELKTFLWIYGLKDCYCCEECYKKRWLDK